MKAQSLALLAQFIARHEMAWSTFAAIAGDIALTGFEFEQHAGQWVITDEHHNRHLFREYGNRIIALTSEFGSYVFIETGEAVRL